jgi:hypothetical protein
MTTQDSMDRRLARWGKRDNRVLIDGRLVATGASCHGVYTTYANWHCRCWPCTDAHRLHMKRHRARRRDERVLVDGHLVAVDAVVHNSSTYSNWSCRCTACQEDWAAMQVDQRRVKRENQNS